MKDLLKVENIEYSIISKENEFNEIIIPSNQNGKIVLDWNDILLENIVININENSNLNILEIGENKNSNIIYKLGKNSNIQIQIFSKDVSYNNSYNFELEEGANLEVAYADFSNGKKALEAKVSLFGRNSSCRWHLAALSREKDFKDFVINFDHIVGETYAKMENYGVCKDEATLNFLGDATIRQGAKKSSTAQTAKIMVFDKTCHAKASPKLCIYENDVDASHGASEGQINQEHVFYLTSRGLSEEEAKRLITFGYLYPILQYFKDEDVRNEIETCIVKRV